MVQINKTKTTMATKQKADSKTGTKKETKFELPDLDTIEADDDGFKDVSGGFDSEFKKFEVGETFLGTYEKTTLAGKAGKEKPCANFTEEKTGDKYLIGGHQVMQAVEKYGKALYEITFTGQGQTKGGQKVNQYKIRVK